MIAENKGIACVGEEVSSVLQRAEAHQRHASDPTVSAWVSASAGTGKTKILVDRLLSLLLTGASPDTLVCLTFTRAAATEMKDRLLNLLAQWALLDPMILQERLTSLLGRTPTSEEKNRARSLYTHVLETPGGISISTIHSFCQKILRQFPLEAGLGPHPQLLTDLETQERLQKGFESAFSSLSLSHPDWIARLTDFFTLDSLQEAVGDLLAQGSLFEALCEAYPSLSAYAHHLLTHTASQDFLENFLTWCQKGRDKSPLSLPFEQAATDWGLWAFSLFPESYLSSSLLDSTHQWPSAVSFLAHEWYRGSPEARASLFPRYKRLFLTQTGQILKKPKISCPEEAHGVQRLDQAVSFLRWLQKSSLLFEVGREVAKQIKKAAAHHNQLTYQDLIHQTIRLFQKEKIAPWILYKMGGGLHHLLLDEAQDTSPDQWTVIDTLLESFFFTPGSCHTLFVVGDIKQSIYSFQGASPVEFLNRKKKYRDLTQAMGREWRELTLDISFRSCREILRVVDTWMEGPERQNPLYLRSPSLASPAPKSVHIPFRQSQGGVYCFPPFVGEDPAPALEPWPIPQLQRGEETPSLLSKVCQHVGDHIQHLLFSQKTLPTTGQPIRPQDILILVKQRGDLLSALSRHLKGRGIPVSGRDRFILTDHLAVEDLIALGEFLVFPEDDFSLAVVLKSPLYGWSEEDLCAVAGGRQGSLWQALKTRYPHSEATKNIMILLSRVDYDSPYALYHFVLFAQGGLKKFRHRFGAEVEEPLLAFLNEAFTHSFGQAQSLQQFLTACVSPREMKRDTPPADCIRMMTIHGAKGLQAPIVWIVEKFGARTPWEKILWSSSPAHSLVMARPAQGEETPSTHTLKEKIQKLKKEEEDRLFYVALTRAQDFLYLVGYGHPRDQASSWTQCLQALDPHLFSQPEDPVLGKGSQQYSESPQMGHLQIDNAAQTVHCLPSPLSPFSPDLSDSHRAPQTQGNLQDTLPHLQDIPEQEILQSTFPLDPSGALLVPSPMDRIPCCEETSAQERGVILHRLFEVLFDLSPSVWETVGIDLLKTMGIQNPFPWIQEAIHVLEGEMLQPFYTNTDYTHTGRDGSSQRYGFSEMEVVTPEGKLLRLDRVVVSPTDSQVSILDFKTTRQVPQDPQGIPAPLLAQMAEYRRALLPFYPQVRVFILWTSGPVLHEIPEALLEVFFSESKK